MSKRVTTALIKPVLYATHAFQISTSMSQHALDIQDEILFELDNFLDHREETLALAGSVLEETLQLSQSAVSAAVRIHRQYLATLVCIGAVLENTHGRNGAAKHDSGGIATSLSHIALQNTKLCDALDEIGGVLVDALRHLKQLNKRNDVDVDVDAA